jgi:hypothetical protein
LSFELAALFLKLPNCGKRNRDLIRRQGIEEDALNKRVDRQSADFLTQRTALLVLGRGRAKIPGKVILWPEQI